MVHRRRQLRNTRKIGLALFVLGAFLVPIGGLLLNAEWTARQNAIMALKGELVPYDVDLSKPFDLFLAGGFPFPLSSDDMANGFSLAKFLYVANFSDDQFIIRFRDNKMFVSATIRNSDNVTIAVIDNNDWSTVNPDTLLFKDRNYNAYAFEIIGKNDIPTVQVVLIGPNKIQIGGLFYTRTGRIDIAPLLNGDSEIYVNPSDQQLIDADIPTIFKYPTLTNPDNLGRMINPKYPSSDPLFEPNALMVVAIILIAVGTILGVYGFEKQKSANDEIARINADYQARIARSRQNAHRKKRSHTHKKG